MYLGTGAPQDSLAHLRRFTALRSLDLPAAAYAEGQLAGFGQLEELTLREGVSQQLLRWACRALAAVGGCAAALWC